MPFYISVYNPDMFLMACLYSAYFQYTPTVNDIERIKQESLPFQFWIYIGTKDQFTTIPTYNRGLVKRLEDAEIQHTYIEDDGNHWNNIKMRIEESIEFFSKFIVDNTTFVDEVGNTPTTWGEIKLQK